MIQVEERVRGDKEKGLAIHIHCILAFTIVIEPTDIAIPISQAGGQPTGVSFPVKVTG